MPVRLGLLIFCLASIGYAQGLQCVALSSSPILHAEGVAERLGEVTMNCTGGQPNQQITGNFNMFLSVNLTNRLSAGSITDIVLTTDRGNGPVASNVGAQLVGANQAVFNGLSFLLSAQGNVVLRLLNVRGNASQTRTANIQMQLAFNGTSLVSVFTNQFTVGIPLPSFLGSTPGRLLCSVGGSPLPEFSNSLVAFAAAGAAVSSFRLTEGFASSFSPRSDQANFLADSGVRFIFRYGGYPSGARIFVPDVVVGTDGTVPTSAGDFGLPIAGGVFTAGSSALLLARVAGADSSGAGGGPVITAPVSGSGVFGFDNVSEVSLQNGAGYAVFEVISGDPFSLQNAQVATFLALPRGTVGSTFQTQLEVSLAAISTAPLASFSAAVPRFVSTAPANDCTALSDCNAPYFPALSVNSPALQFSVNAGGGSQSQFLGVQNGGGGVLFWTASAVYNEVNGWLRVDPPAGFNNGTIRLDILPGGLTPGVYTATIRVNAGVNGSAVVPVRLTVASAPPAIPPFIRAVGNAASETVTALVPGSRASVRGDLFDGQNLLVAIDGIPVAVLEQQRTRLLILVPEALSGKTSATLSIAANGSVPVTLPVQIADVAPVIYPNGVLNTDYSVNSAIAPARAGSAFQVFATGLPLNGTLTGRVHDIDIFEPLYAGLAPGAIGIQQVNLQIDSRFPTFQTFIYVCGQVPGGTRICSPAVPIWMQASQ